MLQFIRESQRIPFYRDPKPPLHHSRYAINYCHLTHLLIFQDSRNEEKLQDNTCYKSSKKVVVILYAAVLLKIIHLTGQYPSLFNGLSKLNLRHQ